MAEIERLADTDHVAVGRLLLEAYADYAARLCLDVLGVERILFAADSPYEDDAEAVRFMDGAHVTEDERRQI